MKILIFLLTLSLFASSDTKYTFIIKNVSLSDTNELREYFEGRGNEVKLQKTRTGKFTIFVKTYRYSDIEIYIWKFKYNKTYLKKEVIE